MLLGIDIEPDVAEAARERMAEAGAKSAPGKGATNDAPFPSDPKRTVDEVAEAVGLTKGPDQKAGRTYERHKKTLAEAEKVAPEVADAINNAYSTSSTSAHRSRSPDWHHRHRQPRWRATIAAASPTTSAGGSRPATM